MVGKSFTCVFRGFIQPITLTSQWVRWRLKSPASGFFTQLFIQMQIKENIKAPRHWPLYGEFTGDRWIPRTKRPVTRKMFPFDDVIMRFCFTMYMTHITSSLYILYIFAWYLYIVVCFIHSRTLAPGATVICWLYPTQNKFYLILSYLQE